MCEAERIETFKSTTVKNLVYRLEWPALTYVIEALKLHLILADWIAGVLRGQGVDTILLTAFIGARAYSSGYAAVSLVDAIFQQKTNIGAAITFMLTGG